MPEPLAPPADGVHIWLAHSDTVRDPATLARYTAMMSADERARHDRFMFARHRQLFLVTRGTIRSLLGAYLGVDPASCRFERDRYGRPSLSHPADASLHFNISHTSGLVACAIASEPEIGVDVEDTTRPVTPGLARRFFSPDEADALEALPEPARRARFYEYWTLKESYIKARGMGLSLPLAGFTMLVDEEPPRIRFAASMADDPASWQFVRRAPTARHRLAVAVRRRGADRPMRFREFVSSV